MHVLRRLLVPTSRQREFPKMPIQGILLGMIKQQTSNLIYRPIHSRWWPVIEQIGVDSNTDQERTQMSFGSRVWKFDQIWFCGQPWAISARHTFWSAVAWVKKTCQIASRVMSRSWWTKLGSLSCWRQGVSNCCVELPTFTQLSDDVLRVQGLQTPDNSVRQQAETMRPAQQMAISWEDLFTMWPWRWKQIYRQKDWILNILNIQDGWSKVPASKAGRARQSHHWDDAKILDGARCLGKRWTKNHVLELLHSWIWHPNWGLFWEVQMWMKAYEGQRIIGIWHG